ncbi:MAG TPA: ribonuclease PH, partial [Conexibacter sp.]|nr:ribonuclease PH [Conexibacter sp.]
MAPERSYGRTPAQLRPVTIEPDFVRSATGSALIAAGETRVICTASVEESVPRWMAGRGTGWLTAEYGMLPASTGRRKPRDATQGKVDGRSVEIQRLIGRSLRGAQLADPLRGEREQLIQMRARERHALGRRLHLHEPALARHHHVRV